MPRKSSFRFASVSVRRRKAFPLITELLKLFRIPTGPTQVINNSLMFPLPSCRGCGSVCELCLDWPTSLTTLHHHHQHHHWGWPGQQHRKICTEAFLFPLMLASVTGACLARAALRDVPAWVTYPEETTSALVLTETLLKKKGECCGSPVLGFISYNAQWDFELWVWI